MPTRQLSKALCADLKLYIDQSINPLKERQVVLEKDLDIVRTRVNEFKEQMTVTQHDISKSLDSMHSKIDKVQDTVDNVKANGRKGLNESISDIYTEIRAIKADQEKNISHSPIWRFLSRPAIAKIMWVLIVYFLIQTIAHLLGYDFNILNVLVQVAK